MHEPKPLTHEDMVDHAASWLIDSHGCVLAITEPRGIALAERPDAVGWHGAYCTLVECKASRADFQADRAKPWRRPGYPAVGLFRYYLAPAGIIPPSELPKCWGLLEYRLGSHPLTIRLDIHTEARACANRSTASELAILVRHFAKFHQRLGAAMRRLGLEHDDFQELRENVWSKPEGLG